MFDNRLLNGMSGPAYTAVPTDCPDEGHLSLPTYGESGGWRRRQGIREQLYVEKMGKEMNKTCLQQHYTSCPARKAGPKKFLNLYGLMHTPCAQALEIFVLLRVLVVYDTCMDIVVTCMIDKATDPFWFAVSCGLIVVPILLKWILFYRICTGRLTKALTDSSLIGQGVAANIAILLYLLLGSICMALVDVYLLLAFPYLTPSASELLGNIERISPIIETFLEGIGQSFLQLYMWIRKTQLGRHTDANLCKILLMSFLPALVNIAKKLWDLRHNAHAAGMGTWMYILEIFKAPLGLSAPFLSLLNHKEEINYDTLGPLTFSQQQDIFRAIGSGNDKLLQLTFDDGNGISLEPLAEAIAENPALLFLGLGEDYAVEEVIEFFDRLRLRSAADKLTVAILRQIFEPEEIAAVAEDGSKALAAARQAAQESLDGKGLEDVSRLDEEVEVAYQELEAVAKCLRGRECFTLTDLHDKSAAIKKQVLTELQAEAESRLMDAIRAEGTNQLVQTLQDMQVRRPDVNIDKSLLQKAREELEKREAAAGELNAAMYADGAAVLKSALSAVRDVAVDASVRKKANEELEKRAAAEKRLNNAMEAKGSAVLKEALSQIEGVKVAVAFKSKVREEIKKRELEEEESLFVLPAPAPAPVPVPVSASKQGGFMTNSLWRRLSR